ncbi:hypothetical protein SLEP1_g6701 [Rubroshorea leprosula]|uniref:Aminotransferase class I/classII large domain-containing protein n=1 Tax=Rubroshorea leprosula TaxID=152421 RepID=A0AAV5HW26_9ROSI|nr:hypothetical protein SLEP1_g6701 [Rubroshorea leprosula]
MENGNGFKRWGFQKKQQDVTKAAILTPRLASYMLMDNLNRDDPRPVVSLGNGDPTLFQCFRTAAAAEDAVLDAFRSANYHSYSPPLGILPARRAIADHLNRDLPYKLSPDDVYVTIGCAQAITVTLEAIASPTANILLPRPGYLGYEAFAAHRQIEVRHYELLPEKGWDVDLDAVQVLADENTVAIVIINPGSPCGNVFSYEHLKKIAETARELGILVIADEVYGHISFGSTTFVPMGVFASIVPVLTLGSLSKRWTVPGWRLGWIAKNDPNGILKETGIVDSITTVLNVSCEPVTFIQGAIPQIIENTKEDFFMNIIGILREDADICYNGIKEIPCMSCPSKPEGGMFSMVKLDPSMLEGINDDLEFCIKLAREESVVVIPGVAVGMKDWLRVNFACEPASLQVGLERMKAFCRRHAKNKNEDPSEVIQTGNCSNTAGCPET